MKALVENTITIVQCYSSTGKIGHNLLKAIKDPSQLNPYQVGLYDKVSKSHFEKLK